MVLMSLIAFRCGSRPPVERVQVSTRGGNLTIAWEGGDNPMWMTGPAVAVFEGEMEIDES